MKLKRLAAILLCLLVSPFISSCGYINFNTAELMSPPKPSGNLYDIQQALENSVSGSIQLKYPTSGDYRTAFTFTDLDSDGKDEVLAFYLTAANTQNMSLHLGLIVQHEDTWVLTSDIAVSASDVESLNFADLNGDGHKDVIVGWTMYSQVDRMVEAYTVSGATLTTRISEPYTRFVTCDLNGNGYDELLVIHQNLTEKTSNAKLMELSSDGVTQLGTARLDGNVTSYLSPVEVTLDTNGEGTKNAVYIDAAKVDGMITEVLVYSDGLINPCIKPDEATNTVTFRTSSATIYDINGDSIPDIPSQTLFLSDDNRTATEAVYLTKWLSFNGTGFTTVLNAIVNYSDGWYLKVPDNWINNVAVIRNTEQRLRSFFLWDRENMAVSGELLRLQVVQKTDYNPESGNYIGIVLAEKDGYIFLGNVGVTGSPLDMTEEQLMNAFVLN